MWLKANPPSFVLTTPGLPHMVCNVSNAVDRQYGGHARRWQESFILAIRLAKRSCPNGHLSEFVQAGVAEKPFGEGGTGASELD